MSTRPRITFDSRGFCNACVWSETKREIDWKSRDQELQELLLKHRSREADFDCIVPVSGGKDGSYVAYTLKEKYGLKILCLTVTPPLPLPLGEKNLRSFVESGFNHISVNPDYEVMRVLNKIGFEEMGFPYYGWLLAIQSIPAIIANKFGIGLVIYGEDGEIEYGGTDETSRSPIFDSNYQKRIYLENGYDKVIRASKLTDSQLALFSFPDFGGHTHASIDLTHWSYFENWDPYRNYLVAKEHCGLQEADSANSGTFTNFSQNDQALYSLHTYLMYLKYGFGRANQDASIEIRRGSMNRDQAKNLVKLYDGQYPEEFLNIYLDYYQMKRRDFDLVLDRYANKDLFEKLNGKWMPRFEIE
jgi:N-acetyl sugar amidotransferase